MPRRTTVLAVPLLAALWAGPSTAQTGGEPTFYESVDVNIVNVEVYVTDRQGGRVQGLAREDFELLEDGKPVEVVNFYAVAEGVATGVPGEADPAAPAPPGMAPEEQRLHLAIVIDQRTLVPATRQPLLDAVQEAASRLGPEDRVLLAAYDGSIRVAQELTADPAPLAAALEEMVKAAPGGMSRDAERRALLRQLDLADSLGGPAESQRTQAAPIQAEQLYYSIRSYAQQQYDETRLALQLLRDFVDALAGLPGRKALLFVSGGLSLRPGEALIRAWETRFASLSEGIGATRFDAYEHDVTPLLEELVDHANSNRVTFYTLGGTTELSGTSAESGLSLNLSSELESIERLNLQAPLQRIAGGTGGLSLIDGGSGVFLERMQDDFETYYSLAYVPHSGRDGRKRTVQVTTRDRSLVVRHREAHRERTVREVMTGRAMAALLLGAAENPLEVALEVGREKRNAKGHFEVEVMVKFPLAKVVLLPQEQFHEGRLRLFITARDSHGRSSPVQEVEVPIRVPNDQLLTALGQVGAYRTILLLRPEPHTVAVAVRDELGNVGSTVRADHTPGRAEGEPAAGEPGT